MSLNDGFHKGPDLLNSLVSILLAWCRDRVALVGDVKKMFNQIEVAESDQIFHRFVWRFGNENSQPLAFQWLRLPFGDRPAPDIATNSVRMLAEISRQSEPIRSNIIDKEMYMDDIGHSIATVEDAVRARNEVDAVLARGKLETNVWNSNHATVVGNTNETVVDVLGHRWDKEHDKFALKSRNLPLDHGPMSKRVVLGLVAKIWDRLGTLAPVSIKYRLDLWRRGVEWDQALDDSDKDLWHAHLIEMKGLVKRQMPCCLKPEDAVGKPQMHCFSDGGARGYGAVLWLRWTLANGSVAVRFVMAKALVAPLMRKSIPRLERMAASIMSRLAKFLAECLGGIE